MSKEIYSEGRVVGASMYETYLKQHLAEFPDIPPASERQWLASSLAMGSSLLLKIPADNRTGTKIKTIDLPANSKLAAGNIILGSVFLGEADFDSSGWARRVTEYRGIDNSSSHAQPTTEAASLSSVKDRMLNYLKLHDWSITFSSQWSAIDPPSSTSGDPHYDMKPDFSNGVSKLNIQYDGPLTTDVYVWLTGFTNKCVLSGIVGDTGSIGSYPSTYPAGTENGAFLGPEIFPWAAPVILMISSEMSYVIDTMQSYIRKYPTTATSAKSVNADAVIDYKYTDPAKMIGNASTSDLSDSLITVDVTDTLYGAGNASKAVLMARSYDNSGKRPAGLYGGVISSTGTANLGPLDTYAPNTVKLFENVQEGKNYETKVPHNYALIRSTADNSFSQIYNNTTIPVAKVTNNQDGSVTIQAGLTSATIPQVSQTVITTRLRGDVSSDLTLARTDWVSGDDKARTQFRITEHGGVDAGAVAMRLTDLSTTASPNYSEYKVLSLVSSSGDSLAMTGASGKIPHVSSASRTSDVDVNYSQVGWRQFVQALHNNTYFDFFEPVKYGVGANTTSGIGVSWNDSLKQMVISNNIGANTTSGINVGWDSTANKLMITNTKPYDPVAQQASYVSLTTTSGSIWVYPCGEFKACAAVKKSTGEYNWVNFDKDGYGRPDLDLEYIRPVSISITSSQDMSTLAGFTDHPRFVTIRISGNNTISGNRYLLGHPRLYDRTPNATQSFEFKHAAVDGSATEIRSRLMYIKFPSKEITVSGLTFNLQVLNDLKHDNVNGYRLRDNSTPDIWNVGQGRIHNGAYSYLFNAIRASWPIYTSATTLTATLPGASTSEHVVCIRATAIGDGYNDQYGAYEDVMRQDTSEYNYLDYLMTHWINLNVEYTLYLPQ